MSASEGSGESLVPRALSVNQLLVRSGAFTRRQLRRSAPALESSEGAPLALRDRVAIGLEPGELRFDDGRVLRYWREVPEIVALHKPRGYVVSRSEPGTSAAPVFDLLRDHPLAELLQPVGRLDAESEGLLLFCEDGQLQHRLQHPRSALPRTYSCILATSPDPRRWDQLARGVLRLRDGHCPRPLELTLQEWGQTSDDATDGRVSSASASAGRVSARAALHPPLPEGRVSAEIVLTEGKYHEVRRAMAACGAPVERLFRTRYGPLSLDCTGLTDRPGAWRSLDAAQRQALHDAVALPCEATRVRVVLRAADED